jgi:hypothetical protein
VAGGIPFVPNFLYGVNQSINCPLQVFRNFSQP